jgi:hypothetical protein
MYQEIIKISLAKVLRSYKGHICGMQDKRHNLVRFKYFMSWYILSVWHAWYVFRS